MPENHLEAEYDTSVEGERSCQDMALSTKQDSPGMSMTNSPSRHSPPIPDLEPDTCAENQKTCDEGSHFQPPTPTDFNPAPHDSFSSKHPQFQMSVNGQDDVNEHNPWSDGDLDIPSRRNSPKKRHLPDDSSKISKWRRTKLSNPPNHRRSNSEIRRASTNPTTERRTDGLKSQKFSAPRTGIRIDELLRILEDNFGPPQKNAGYWAEMFCGDFILHVPRELKEEDLMKCWR